MYIKKNKETGKKNQKKLLCDLLVSDFVAAKYVNHPTTEKFVTIACLLKA